MTLNRMRVKKSHEKIIFWERERNKFLKKGAFMFYFNKQTAILIFNDKISSG